MRHGGFVNPLRVLSQTRLVQFVSQYTWLKQSNKLTRIQRQLVQDLGRDPMPEEIMQEKMENISAEKVQQKFKRLP